MEKKEQKKKIARVVFSLLVVLGSFLPLVYVEVDGKFYFFNITGILYLLPILAFTLVGLSVFLVYKNIAYEKIWISLVSILGLLLNLYGVIQGKVFMQDFVERMIAFEKEKIEFEIKFEKQRREIESSFDNFDMEKSDSEKERELNEAKKSLENIKINNNIGLGAILNFIGFLGVLIISFFIKDQNQNNVKQPS